MSDEPFEIVDPSGLTDADWVEINKLKAAYASGEERALDKAMGELANKHPIRYLAVLAAFFPDMTRHSIDSRMADPGVKEEDIRELIGGWHARSFAWAGAQHSQSPVLSRAGR